MLKSQKNMERPAPVRGGPFDAVGGPSRRAGRPEATWRAGPEGGTHVAIGRTRRGRGGNPGAGFPSSSIVLIVSGGDGRVGGPGRRIAGWGGGGRPGSGVGCRVEGSVSD